MKLSPHFSRIKKIAISLLEQGCGGYAPDKITRLKGWRLTNCVGRAVGAAVEQVRDERRIKQPKFFGHQNFNLVVRTIIEEMQQEEVHMKD
jgi:hypothetical protein